MTKYSHADLQAIARRQKQVILCVLFHLLVLVPGSALLVPALRSLTDSVDVLISAALVWAALILGFWILSIVLFFRLAHKVFGAIGTIMLAMVWLGSLGGISAMSYGISSLHTFFAAAPFF